MKTIEEKAYEYAKEISLSYVVFGASTLICDAIKEVAERAYLKCYEDIIEIPLSERLTEGEKTKVNHIYKSLCSEEMNACNYEESCASNRGKEVLYDIFGADFFKEGGEK